MPRAIVLTTAPEAPDRAASWLCAALAEEGLAPERAGRVAARIAAAWRELVACLCPTGRERQMLLLSLVPAEGGLALELVAERQGRLRADLAERARGLGLTARRVRTVEGLAGLRLAL